jgi:plasmid replication initiation protein
MGIIWRQKLGEKTTNYFPCRQYSIRLSDIAPKIIKSMKPKEVSIRQDNAITRAAYDMTALEKNILYVLISQINANDAADKSYFVSAREIMDRTGDEIDVKCFKRATKQLVTRYFETWIEPNKLLQATFISAAVYHMGRGVIEIDVNKRVLPLFVDMKQRFTTMQLNTALSLNSKYSKRIYEFVSMLKGMKDPTQTISLIDLKKMLMVIDKEGKDTYPKFSDFKKRVLDPSEKEINALKESDLSFTYEAIGDKNSEFSGKSGRVKIKSIKFSVLSQKAITEGVALPTDAVLIIRLRTEFSMRQDQAEAIVLGNDRKYILAQLYQISLSKNRIKNIGAYTAKLFGV